MQLGHYSFNWTNKSVKFRPVLTERKTVVSYRVGLSFLRRLKIRHGHLRSKAVDGIFSTTTFFRRHTLPEIQQDLAAEEYNPEEHAPGAKSAPVRTRQKRLYSSGGRLPKSPAACVSCCRGGDRPTGSPCPVTTRNGHPWRGDVWVPDNASNVVLWCRTTRYVTWSLPCEWPRSQVSFSLLYT